MSVRDRIRRRLLPRVVVALSTVRVPRRVAARIRRSLGGAATVRLYVAFDDPHSAVALLGLADRLRERRVRLAVEPVVKRGIPGDPALAAKRAYALTDARRLARRSGLELSRQEPLAAEAAAFLAAWCASVPREARASFCEAAMRLLWFESNGPPPREPFAALWREHVGGEPPADGAGRVRRAERGMRLRRLYDTPAAVVHGQWFFAHERLMQIEQRLDELGWRAAA